MIMIMFIRILCKRRFKNMYCWFILICYFWKDCKREFSRLYINMEIGIYSRRYSRGNIMELNNIGNFTIVEEVMNFFFVS